MFKRVCSMNMWMNVQVLEWGGVQLTDRSFEDVCTIMDHTGEVVELLVEHGMDL